MFLLDEKQIMKHPNADRLSIVEVDFTPVISNNPKAGEWYLYFPTESVINESFLSFTNSFRKAERNRDKDSVGFFEDNCRVKTIKLRGEYSSGYIVPLSQLESFLEKSVPKEETYFDQIDDIILIKKYKKNYNTPNITSSKTDRKAAKVNIVEGQFQFHEETANIRREYFKLFPEDTINISFKCHGTSHVACNILFNKPKKLNKLQSLWYKIFKKSIPKEQVYDYVASSRKVIKLNSDGNPGFYGEDIWTHALNTFKDKIPKGWSIYSELIGYLPSGGYIQNEYDYGCDKGKYKIMPYRITVTDRDGNVVELSPEQIVTWTKSVGLEPMPIFFTGTVLDHYNKLLQKHFSLELKAIYDDYLEAKELKHQDYDLYVDCLNSFRKHYIKLLELEYNEKDCYMCKNKVPEEGIIIRKLGAVDKFEAYKLKSFRFLGMESAENDKNTSNIEDQESL